eukprot:2344274-Ditylum_brightwellii.AAC.1
MPQNKNVQVENEEENEGNNYLLGCASMQQEVGNRLCGLHSLNNTLVKRTFKEELLWNIQQSTQHCVNDLVTDEMEVDEFEEDEL